MDEGRGKEVKSERLGEMDGWGLFNVSVEARGIFLTKMKRDGTHNVFLGYEGGPKGFGIGLEASNDL